MACQAPPELFDPGLDDDGAVQRARALRGQNVAFAER
jgi:hypothetical protein